MAQLDKWAIYDTKVKGKPLWEPHRGQLVVAENTCRHKVLCAGRRFGKDNIGANDKILPEIFFTKPIANQLLMDGKRRIFWLVGPSYSESEKCFRIVWDLCKRLEIPMDKGSYNNSETGSMQISLFDGAFQCIAKSAQMPERLVGEGLSGAILCEAAKLKESIWVKYIRPTLADFNGWSFHASTPESYNWFYDLWRLAQDPNNTQWASWRMPAWINHNVYKTPTLEEDVTKLLDLQRNSYESVYKLVKKYDLTIDIEILDSLNELTPEAFKQEIGAEFTAMVGRVFGEFDEEIHVTDLTYNPAWQTVAAVDYGFNNPNVWLLIQIGPWGEVNVLDEIYESGLDPEDFAYEIKRRGLNPPHLRTMYADPADPLSTKILEKKLHVRSAGGTGGELIHRINHIRKALRAPRIVTPDDFSGIEEGTKRPQLLFDRKCKNTILDMLNYRYPEKRKDGQYTSGYENPLKKNDHGPEALGRFFAGIFGTYGKPSASARIHKVHFSLRDDQSNYNYSDAELRTMAKAERYTRLAHGESRREL